jgi:AraC-like DNA-binding protein
VTLTGQSSAAAGCAQPAVHVIDESDDYTAAVAGITVESTRVGQGVGPNVVLSAPGKKVTVTSSHFGFPMTAGAQVLSDRIIAIVVHRNPHGSKWCGVHLKPGAALLYTPGAEHAAINQPGLHFTFAVAEPERLAATSTALGTTIDIPRSSGLHELPPSHGTHRLVVRLGRFTSAAIAGESVGQHEQSLLEAFAGAIHDDPSARPLEPSRGRNSKEIMTDCIEYADAIGRIPGNAELCRAAHVSERRLRSAFCEEFDRSPSVYFRMWALDRVHRRLRDAGPGDCTVSQAACDLGLEHLGRFSGWYREVYGETPSATLRAL